MSRNQRNFLEESQQLLKEKRSKVTNEVTSFGGIFAAPKIGHKLHINAPCIGPLVYGGTKEWCGLQTFFIFNQAVESDVSHQKFLDWILSPEYSPWKALIRAQSPQDRDFINKYGYVLDNLSFSTNYVANFLTAFRTPREKPGIVKMWWALVEEGVQPGTAAWICGAFSNSVSFRSKTADYDTKFMIVGDTGHYFISPCMNGPDCIRRLNEGDPSEKTMHKYLFKDNTYYTPCNTVWSDVTGNYGAQKALQSFANRLNKPSNPVKRVFSDPVQHGMQICPTFPQVVEICKALERNEIIW